VTWLKTIIKELLLE